jgi:hypothetical protein
LKYLFNLLFLALILVGCSKDNQNVPTNGFPNQIGDKWVYRLTESYSDTLVQVEIVGQGTLPNGVNAKIWKYTYQNLFRNYVDTFWVSNINDDVRIYYKPCFTCTEPMPDEKLHYIFPLSVGNSWYTIAAYGDTTKVIDKESISVPAGTFNNVFRLSKVQGYVNNSWTNDTIFFQENVGIVKLIQHEANLGPVPGDGVWELISYSLH